MKSYLHTSGLLAAGVAICAISLTAQAGELSYEQPAVTNPAAGQAGVTELGTQASQTAVTVGTNSGGRFSVFAEAMMLKPVNDQLHYAFKSPAEIFSSVPVGSDLESVDTDFAPGFRAGAGMTIGNSGMDVNVAFSYLKSKNVSRVSQPAGGDIGATRVSAGAGLFEANSASGKYNLDNIVVDLEVGQKLNLGSSLGMRLFAGLRYASMETRLKASYDGDDFGTGMDRGTVTDSSDMFGIGPRLGASMMWGLPAGFSVGGDIAGSLLIGNMDVKHTEVDSQFLFVEVEEEETSQLFPVLESKLSIGWQKKFSDRIGMAIEAGYRYQIWFNAQGNVQLPDDVSPTHLSNERSDIGLHGPFLSASMSF